MAIYHLSTTPVSRSTGRSAVGAAAYRSASSLTDYRTGQTFDYTRKEGVLSSEIVMPGGKAAPDREVLWNAADAAEKRKDARVAREWRVALPSELNHEARQVLARDFAKCVADRYGVAVDVCVHAPDKGGDERNFHAHMLATTRRVNENGSLGAKADIEIGNKDRVKAGIRGTQQQDICELRAEWGRLSNEALEKSGNTQRIDHRSYADQGIELSPTKHIGVAAVGMDRRGIPADRIAEFERIREEQANQIEANPSVLLDKITRTQAVFDRRDIARELNRYIDDPQRFKNLFARLENDKQLVRLAPEHTEDGRLIPAKFSTREMVETERTMADTAERLAASRGAAVKPGYVADAIERRGSLSEEQRRVVEHVTGRERLAVVIGDAGTGKSFAMGTAREAWEAQGLRVRGCALSGKAADGLKSGSGIESSTIHRLEYGLQSGRDRLTSKDVIVMDEAGMVGSRQLGRVLAEADRAGAKVVLLGDDKQLAAIEAGAGFRAITERTGATEITEIRRQHEVWARDASAEFARGDVRRGLDAYQEHGAVRMAETREDAKQTLAADYLRDRAQGGSSIILAHANKDVSGLNETIRQARLEAGELGPGMCVETVKGQREFAAGDRMVFLKNDADLDVKNGTLGTVEQVQNGRLSVQLDDGRSVGFRGEAYNHIDHGYAVTIHKAQGVTVDRAYVLASPSMDRSLAYVGMTRHRESAALYAGGDDFASYDKLAKNLERERPKESTLDFAERHGVEVERAPPTSAPAMPPTPAKEIESPSEAPAANEAASRTDSGDTEAQAGSSSAHGQTQHANTESRENVNDDARNSSAFEPVQADVAASESLPSATAIPPVAAKKVEVEGQPEAPTDSGHAQTEAQVGSSSAHDQADADASEDSLGATAMPPTPAKEIESPSEAPAANEAASRSDSGDTEAQAGSSSSRDQVQQEATEQREATNADIQKSGTFARMQAQAAARDNPQSATAMPPVAAKKVEVEGQPEAPTDSGHAQTEAQVGSSSSRDQVQQKTTEQRETTNTDIQKDGAFSRMQAQAAARETPPSATAIPPAAMPAKSTEIAERKVESAASSVPTTEAEGPTPSGSEQQEARAEIAALDKSTLPAPIQEAEAQPEPATDSGALDADQMEEANSQVEALADANESSEAAASVEGEQPERAPEITEQPQQQADTESQAMNEEAEIEVDQGITGSTGSLQESAEQAHDAASQQQVAEAQQLADAERDETEASAPYATPALPDQEAEPAAQERPDAVQPEQMDTSAAEAGETHEQEAAEPQAAQEEASQAEPQATETEKPSAFEQMKQQAADREATAQEQPEQQEQGLER